MGFLIIGGESLKRRAFCVLCTAVYSTVQSLFVKHAGAGLVALKRRVVHKYFSGLRALKGREVSKYCLIGGGGEALQDRAVHK